MSSLSGRDWSCFGNTVYIAALSAVGAAFSAGVGAVCGGAVCAVAPELNAVTPASTAIPVQDPFACEIAISFLDSLRDGFGSRSLRGYRGPANRNRLKNADVAAPCFAAGCEASHTSSAKLAPICGDARPPPACKDRIDESAADGLLVVQVCRLGTISREIPQAAPPLIHRRDDRRFGLTPFNQTISQPDVFVSSVLGNAPGAECR